jgi:hypothetical protein
LASPNSLEIGKRQLDHLAAMPAVAAMFLEEGLHRLMVLVV